MTRTGSRNSSLVFFAALILFLILIVAFTGRAQNYEVTNFPTLGGKLTRALPINDQGQIVSPPHSGLGSTEGIESMLLKSTEERKSIATSTAQTFVFLLFPPVLYDLGGATPISIAVADLNMDGKPDLVVFGNANVFGGGGLTGVFLGNGDGTFRPIVNYSSGGFGVESGAVADVNRDGIPDLVVANCSNTNNLCNDGKGSIGVLLGNGDGSFRAAITYPLGGASFTESLVVADVNHDGKPDVLVTSRTCLTCLGAVSVLLGNGDGSFRSAETYSSGGATSTSVAVADVNRDNWPDLLVANNCSQGNYRCETNGSIGVLLGNGDGTFQSVITYDSGGVYTSSVTAVDVNGDGNPDLVAANPWSDTVGVLLGNGAGSFNAPVTYNAPGASSVTVTDVNGDGNPDIVVGSAGVGVLLGNGDGTFGPVVTYDLGHGGTPVAVADVNGDGKPDLVVVQLDGAGVMLNNNQAPGTTTSLAPNVNPVTMNESVTYTASVTSQFGGTVNGTVEFLELSHSSFPYYFPFGATPLQGNRAAVSRSYSYPFAHTITAVYSGELNLSAGSISNTLTENVRGTSRTVVTTSKTPSMVHEPVTFIAKVTSQYGLIPDGGLVTFSDGRMPLSSVALAGGQAIYTTSSLPGGRHTVRATYAGNTYVAGSLGSVNQTVLRYLTSTSLTSSLNPAMYGQNVTWMAKVTASGSAPPTGSVAFQWSYGGQVSKIGTVSVNSSGIASLSRSNLTANPFGSPYAMDAVYSGDLTNSPSSSSLLLQNVLQTKTGASITSSVNPSKLGQPVTFTARITSPTVMPTGPVAFSIGYTHLGTAQLNGGYAKFTTSALPVGASRVKVTYSGNSNIAQSSAVVLQNVQ